MSLSIFNSEAIVSLLPSTIKKSLTNYSHLGQLNIDLVVAPFFFVLITLIVVIYVWKKQWRFRLPIYFLLGVFIVRILLWNNPVAWFVYFKTLNWKDVGFRQVTVMADQIGGYFMPSKDLKYLAIGSSQTGAVYSNYSKHNDHLYKVQFSGMGPVEYFLYRDLVDRIDPEYVLLYLSDFDLARPPNYDTFRYVPWQGLDLFSYGKLILAHDGRDRSRNALKGIILGNFFPEYRFSYIYKGYMKKIFNSKEVFKGLKINQRDIESDELVSNQAKGLEGLHAEHIGLSLAALDRFITYCKKRETTVVIVEGNYHPNFYSEKNIRLNEICVNGLKQLCDKYPNAYFIPADKLPALTEDDFRDTYHVSDESGENHAENIVNYIRSNIEDSR